MTVNIKKVDHFQMRVNMVLNLYRRTPKKLGLYINQIGLDYFGIKTDRISSKMTFFMDFVSHANANLNFYTVNQ